MEGFFAVNNMVLIVFSLIAVVLIGAFGRNKKNLITAFAVAMGVNLAVDIAVMLLFRGIVFAGGFEVPIITFCTVLLVFTDKKNTLIIAWCVATPFIVFGFVFTGIMGSELGAYEGSYYAIEFAEMLSAGLAEIAAMAAATVVRFMRKTKEKGESMDSERQAGLAAELTGIAKQLSDVVRSLVGEKTADGATAVAGGIEPLGATGEGAGAIPPIPAGYTPAAGSTTGNRKEEKSAWRQYLIFTLVPSIVTVLGIILTATAGLGGIIVLIVGIVYSGLGAYLIGYGFSVGLKIKPPQGLIPKLGAAKTKVASARKREYTEDERMRALISKFWVLIWLVPVGVFGWLIFILYSCGKILNKIRTAAIDCDRADDIIAAQSGDPKDVVYYTYRLVDYANAYSDINNKKGAKQFLDRAENLLGVWELLYPSA